MRLEKELKKIKKLKSEEERLKKLQEICTDDESLNDALEIAKHESTLYLPGAILITAAVAVILNFFPDVYSRIVILIMWSFIVWYFTNIEFEKWKDVYYDLIELRRNKRINYICKQEKSASGNGESLFEKSIENIKGKWQKIRSKAIENLNLDRGQKIELIGLLLLVSSILVALKPTTDNTLTNNLTWLFILFIFLSIIYYIIIQKGTLEPCKLLDLIALFISCIFSALVNFNLFYAFIKDTSLPLTGLILYWVYYFTLTLFLWIALLKR